MEPTTMAMGAGLLGSALKYGADVFGSTKAHEAERKAQAMQIQGVKDALAQGNLTYDDLAKMYQGDYTSGQGYADQLKSGIASGAFTPQMGQFEYDKSVQSFLDPSIDYQQEQAQNQMQESQAAQGGMYSGGAMKELQDRAQNIGQMGYQQAYQNQQADKKFTYDDWMNHFNNDKSNALTNHDLLQGQVQRGDLARNQLAEGMMGKAQLGMGATQQISDISANRARQSGDYWKNIISGGGNLASQMLGKAANSLSGGGSVT